MKAELKQQRRDFLVRGRCALCGDLPHDVHEILAGANRTAAVAEPACWLRVCRGCHDQIQGMEVEFQLAIKCISDPGGFDLDAFCKAWRRPRTAVNDALVLQFVRAELFLRQVTCR